MTADNPTPKQPDMTAPTAPQGDWLDEILDETIDLSEEAGFWAASEGQDGVPPDITKVRKQQAKAAIRSRISEAEAAIRRSQTDHLFSVIRHCGYKIDQRAVEKLSKQWNDAAAKHAAEVQARQADKPTLADIASPNPSEAAQAAVQRAVDASIKRQADTSGRE